MRSLICCPQHPEEQAEAYCLQRMPEFAAHHFENHYLLCHACATTLEHTLEFVEGLRAVNRTAAGRMAS